MTIKNILQEGREQLKNSGIDSASLESQLLLCHVLKCDRHRLIIRENENITEESAALFLDFISQRKTHKPVAYITGEKEFFSQTFVVNSSTLIPRPETEELIEWILEDEPACSVTADVCAGSGCIGITLANNLPVKEIWFTDISGEALDTAGQNAGRLLAKHKSPVAHFIKNDLLENTAGPFDLIVTNPPYVLPGEYEQLMPDVKNFEPEIALVVNNFENFYRRLFEQSVKRLNNGGAMYVETNPVFIDAAARLMSGAGFTGVKIKSDLSQKRRFLKGFNSY